MESEPVFKGDWYDDRQSNEHCEDGGNRNRRGGDWKILVAEVE
jgi:hypothetical protein